MMCVKIRKRLYLVVVLSILGIICGSSKEEDEPRRRRAQSSRRRGGGGNAILSSLSECPIDIVRPRGGGGGRDESLLSDLEGNEDEIMRAETRLPIRIEQFVIENGNPAVGHPIDVRLVGLSDREIKPDTLVATIAYDGVPLHTMSMSFCDMKYSGSITAEELPADVPPPVSVVGDQREHERVGEQANAGKMKEESRTTTATSSTTRNAADDAEKGNKRRDLRAISPGTHFSKSKCRMKKGLFYVQHSFRLPETMFRGNYDVLLRGYDESGKLILCEQVRQMVSYGTTDMEFHDYVKAAVAFAVAAASSYYLGQFFPFFTKGLLPLITGYLGIGIMYVYVDIKICSTCSHRILRHRHSPCAPNHHRKRHSVGPFVTSLVSAYDVHLLSNVINEFALSFIASSAGCEIYFPELRGLVKPILVQLGFLTLATFLIVTAGVYLMTPLVPFLVDQTTDDCRASISLLLSSVMLARSPATAVAIISELQATGPGSKQMLGITVVSDIVVLVSYDVIVGITRLTCGHHSVAGSFGAHESVESNDVYFLFTEIGLSILIGSLVGLLIRFYLWLPFKRFIIPCPGLKIRIYRSQLKACFILPTLLGMFEFTRFFAEFSLLHFGKSCKLEPLLLCIVAGCVAGHSSRQRKKFGNILEKVAPAVFLPFFVLTGASLQLDDVHRIALVASCVCGLRLVAIFVGSTTGGTLQRLCGMRTTVTEIKYMWMTLLAQAGVALGLAISTKKMFPSWGAQFETLVISVVVINQIIGPVLCKLGLYRIELRAGKNDALEGGGGGGGGERRHGNSSGRRKDVNETTTLLPHNSPAARGYAEIGMSQFDAEEDDEEEEEGEEPSEDAARRRAEESIREDARFLRATTLEDLTSAKHHRGPPSTTPSSALDPMRRGTGGRRGKMPRDPLRRRYERLLRKYEYGTLARLANQLDHVESTGREGRARMPAPPPSSSMRPPPPPRRSESGLFYRHPPEESESEESASWF